MERYRLVEKLGEGGMGEVFRAHDNTLRRDVALKFLKNVAFASAEALERFSREIRALCALSHPNIVKLLDVGEMDGSPYFAMEYFPAKDLALLLKSGPLDPQLCLSILTQLLDAVGYLHERQIIHRDIKPSNILVMGTRAVLTDFGVVRRDGEQLLTAAGCTMGTPKYMAPELFVGEAATVQSDLWSVGVLTYEMFAGQVPFPECAIPPRGLNAPITPLSRVRAGTPSGVQVLVDALLAKNPLDRPNSATAARALLRRTPTAKVPRPAVRQAWRLPVAVLAAALAAGLTGRLYFRPQLAPPASPSPRPVVTPTPAPAPLSISVPPAPLRDAILRLRPGTEAPQARLRQDTPLEFGRWSTHWRYWVELMDWLQRPAGKPPILPDGSLVPGERGFYMRRFTNANTSWPSRVTAGFQLVRDSPEDGRSWLVLGRVLQQDHQVERAHAAYAVALARLKPSPHLILDEVEWEGLVEALLASGRDISSSWYDWLPPVITETPKEDLRRIVQSRRGWMVLQARLFERGERRRFRDLVERGLALPRGSARYLRVIYVQLVYMDLVGAQLDPYVRDSYEQFLARGGLRAQVATAILGSEECRRADILRLFRRHLHRDPDAPSVYTHYLQATRTHLEILHEIVSSDEYFETAGGQLEMLVPALYREFLDRPVDPAGAALEATLLRGGNRAQVVQQFLELPAVRRQRVRTLVRSLFAREPTAAELERFTRADQPCDPEHILPDLMSTSEYLPLQR